MKPLLRILFFIFPVFLMVPDFSFGSHISGGDISYQCLGGGQYKITLNLFRDCSGISMSTSETINIDGGCGNQTLTANLVNLGGTEISQLCPQQTPNSTCNNGNLPGMERYTYEVTTNIPPCSDWIISWSTCCRNLTVNVPTSDGDGSYFEATLNSVIDSCNNSPVFTSQPIPYVCANTQVIYNWGITEADGDSLTYQFIDARSDATTNLNYTSPYSATNPINGITIDQFTGQITFTPTIIGNFIVAVLVNEYDDAGNLIGTTMRDIQFVVQTCSNNPPPAGQGQIDSLTGTSNQTGPFSLELCDGGNFSFNISFLDSDLADVITLTSNVTTVLPGAIFTTVPGNPANGTISWTAPAGSNFFNYFTVYANDGACPVPGIQSSVYQVSVNPGTVAGPDTTVLCGPQTVQLIAENGNTFVWSVISGDPIVEGVNFSCDTCPNPIASPAITTFYEVVSDLTTTTCVNRDTVQVKVVPDFTFTKTQSDSAICLQEEVQFAVTPDSTSSAYTYFWTPSGIFDDNTISGPIATFYSSGTKKVFFSITSDEGCLKTDSMQVLVSTGLKPNVFVVADTSICMGDSSNLVASILNAIPQSCGLSTNICGGTPTPLTIGTSTAVLGNTSYPAPYGNWYEGAKHQILFLASELQAQGFQGGQITSLALNIASISGTTIYNNFEIKMGCTSLTSIATWQTGLVTVFPSQTINISTGWNTHTFSNGFDWDGTSNIIVDICFNNQPATWTNNSPTYYTATTFNSVIYYNADVNPTLCSSPTFVNISKNRPNIKFSSCGGSPPDSYVYAWEPSIGLSDSSIANPWANPPSDTTYTVTVTDTIGGCADTATVTLHIVPNFTFTKTQSDTTICKGDEVLFTSIPDSSSPSFTYSWLPDTGVTLNYDSIYNPNGIFDSSGTQVIHFTISNAGGCNKSDSMIVFVGPAARPIVTILADTTICSGDSIQLNAIISNSGPSSNYSYSWYPAAGLSDSSLANPWGNPSLDTNLYSVIVNDTVGDCSDTASINLYVIAGFNFTKFQSDDSVCMQEQVQFLVSPDSSGNPYSYSWFPATYLNDTAISNPVGTFTSPGIKTKHFNITNAGGCTKNDSMIVFVAPAVKPEVAVTGDTALCLGEAGQLNATVTNNIPLSCGLSSTACGGNPNTYILGTGTSAQGSTSYPAPYGNFYYGARHQILYLASELQALGFNGGQITSIAFNVQSVQGTSSYNGFTLKMGCTSLSNLDANTFQTGMVTVFGPQNITIATGLNTHTFPNGFSWDGNSNIIVEVCFYNSTGFTNNSPTYYTTTSFNSVIWNNQDANPNICSDATVSFSSPSKLRPNIKFGTCQSSSSSGFIYSWSPGLALSDDSIANPIANPNSSTLYTVVVKDSSGTCSDTSQINVFVGPSFTYNVVPFPSAICLGQSVQFNVIPGAGTYTYLWTPAANLNSTTISNPKAGPMNVADTFTYNVNIASAFGCDLDTNLSFVVSPGKVPDVTITGKDSICEGENTQLIASSSGGNSPTYSFVWTPSTSLSNANVNNPIASPTVTTNYSITVKDTIGNCSDIANHSITVNPAPDVQITPLADSVCLNDNVVMLSATPPGGKWNGTGTTVNGFFAPGIAGVGAFKINYQDTVNGCVGYDTLLLNVFPNPAVPTAVTNNPYCAYTLIDSIAGVTLTGGNITWFSDSLLTDTFFYGNPIYNVPAGADSFDLWVKETSLVGCESNGAFKITIQVNPNPVAVFTASPTEGFSPLDVTFNNSTQPDSNNFIWNFAGLDSSFDYSPSFTFDQPGSYQVILLTTDSNGCTDTATAIIIVNKKDSIIMILDSLVIPNIFTPNGDGKNDVFKLAYTFLSDFHIKIFNRWGRVVNESTDPSVGWNGKDMQGQYCSAGVYFYVFSANDRNGNPISREEIKGTITLVRD